MAYISCWIAPRNGRDPVHIKGMDHEINFKLPPNKTYLVALDQATQSTGVYITDTELSFHFICDFQSTSGDKYRYFEELRLFIRRIFTDCKIGLFVLEDIPPVKGRKHAGAALRELRGAINTWRGDDRMPMIMAIPSDRWVNILPNSWKSKMYDKSKGTGRFNDKRSIAEDICDKFPELREYLHRCPSKDYDSYDACGILHGYLATHYGEGGQKIAGKKDFYGDVITFYRLIDRSLLKEPSVIMKYFEVQQYNHKSHVLALNKDQSLYNNYLMATAKYPFVMTIIDDLMQSIAVRWQFDLGMNDKALVAYILRKNIMTKKQVEFLKDNLSYEEILS